MSPKTETEEQRKKRLEYHREYARKHREELVAKARARRAENPEKYREAFRRYYATHKEQRQAISNARERSLQEMTLETATKKFQPWTDREDELLLSSPLTTQELALEMSRTYASVSNRRARLRREARAQAQLAESVTEVPDSEEPASLED